MHQQNYIKGMREGIPVGLGYFVVSFTIGIAARKADLTPVQAAVMSFTNDTFSGHSHVIYQQYIRRTVCFFCADCLRGSLY